MTIILSSKSIEIFEQELLRRERSAGTIAQYTRSLQQLRDYLAGDQELTRERLLAWKKDLAERYAARTVNCAIAAVNFFLELAGAPQLKLSALKCQRQVFREDKLTKEDLQALLSQAEREGDHQTMVLLQVMSGTGLRVSELRTLTVEAARHRMAVVRLKGKTRQVPLGDQMCRQLLAFAREEGITSGPIFLGNRGKPLDRRRIWERLKVLCPGAGIDPARVYPHALRHLFARLFYDMTQDIAKLADLLGHSSIDTTRIYITTSCREHRSMLDRLALQLSAKKPPNKGSIKTKRTKSKFCPKYYTL